MKENPDVKKFFSDPSGQIKLPGEASCAVMAALLCNFTEPSAPRAAQSPLAAAYRRLPTGSKRTMMARRRRSAP